MDAVGILVFIQVLRYLEVVGPGLLRNGTSVTYLLRYALSEMLSPFYKVFSLPGLK